MRTEGVLREEGAGEVESESGPCTDSTLVAVIDSGWDRALDEPRVLAGKGFAHPDRPFHLELSDDDHDRNGHGTACTNLVLDLSPRSRILPLRVFGRHLETDPEVLVAAIEAALDAGARVVNMSLGTHRDDALEPLYLVCERARRAGVVLVAAAANRHPPDYPAVFENTIGVISGRDPDPLGYTYRAYEAVEVVGSGPRHRVRGRGGVTHRAGGNSYAAPKITAIVARLLEKHPEADLDAVRSFLAKERQPKVPTFNTSDPSIRT